MEITYEDEIIIRYAFMHEENRGHVRAINKIFWGKILGQELCQFHVGPYKPD